ncbi:hypothetical protein [Halorussus litoreus]|uniref:hypothetical protein n=1 Tax=Halorussus litoreus TaxID=1710536 RepID=UPI000E272857|nr:hypothetical protein [Halorussus litoreus]
MSSNYRTDVLKIALGLAVMSFPLYTTAKHLLITFSSNWTKLGETGTLGAAFALLLFLLGASAVAHGLFTGIERAVRAER